MWGTSSLQAWGTVVLDWYILCYSNLGIEHVDTDTNKESGTDKEKKVKDTVKIWQTHTHIDSTQHNTGMVGLRGESEDSL